MERRRKERERREREQELRWKERELEFREREIEQRGRMCQFNDRMKRMGSSRSIPASQQQTPSSRPSAGVNRCPPSMTWMEQTRSTFGVVRQAPSYESRFEMNHQGSLRTPINMIKEELFNKLSQRLGTGELHEDKHEPNAPVLTLPDTKKEVTAQATRGKQETRKTKEQKQKAEHAARTVNPSTDFDSRLA